MVSQRGDTRPKSNKAGARRGRLGVEAASALGERLTMRNQPEHSTVTENMNTELSERVGHR